MLSFYIRNHRIALVKAILCIVSGFIGGLFLADSLKRETQEYVTWYSKYSHIKKQIDCKSACKIDPLFEQTGAEQPSFRLF
jgi:hypothetical protein